MVWKAKTVKWVQNGYVLAYVKDKPYFLRGALPGEEVSFSTVKETKSHGFGIVESIHEKSKHRIQNDCRVFPYCGGCSFRNIDYLEEIEVKRSLLEEFSEISFFLSKVNYDFFLSPPDGYRNQVKIHSNGKNLGFFRLFSNELIPLPEDGCKNLPEALNNYLLSSFDPDFKEKKVFYIQKKFYENQEFRFQTKNTDWLVSTDCFLQTNRFLIHSWLDWIESQVKLFFSKKIRVLDLFCGTSIIAGYLHSYLSYVEGYDSVAKSIEYAKKNFQRLGIEHRFYQADLYRKVPPLHGFDLVIVNPPRKGMGKKLLQAFSHTSSPVIYSSCNPATFNRDLKVLRKYRYTVKNMAVLDFFPRTPHLEIIAFLTKDY